MPEPLRTPRLLDQLWQHIRYLHCSLRTEQCCVQWVRRFIRPLTQTTDSRTGYVSNSGFACPYLYIVARRPASG